MLDELQIYGVGCFDVQSMYIDSPSLKKLVWISNLGLDEVVLNTLNLECLDCITHAAPLIGSNCKLRVEAEQPLMKTSALMLKTSALVLKTSHCV